MKFKFLSLIFLFITSALYAQNVGINSTGNAPDASAGLDISFSNKGLLIPRVSLTDLTSSTSPINSPAKSLLVYNLETSTGTGFFYWDGSKWTKLFDENNHKVWLLTGNSGTSSSNFLGTTDQQYLQVKTNNTLRMLVDDNNNRLGIGSDFSLGDPQNNIEIRESFGSMRISAFNNYDWGYPKFYLQKSRGTTSSPSAAEAGDVLGVIGFMGGNNSNVSGVEGAEISAIAETDWSSAKKGSLIFSTNNDGGITERARITAEGKVGIATTSPTEQLDVNGFINSQTVNNDAVFTSLDKNTSPYRKFHLIGTYHGWDPEAVYIAGYNYYNPLNGNVNNSYAKKVYIGGNPVRLAINLYNGYVGIGTTSPAYKLEVDGTIKVSDDAYAQLILGRQDNSHEGGQMYFRGAGSYDSWTVDLYDYDFRIWSNSSNNNSVQIFNNGSGVTDLRIVEGKGISAGGWTTSSDKRIKSNVKDLPYGLSAIMKLQPVEYNKRIVKELKNGQFKYGNTIHSIGFIAQDVYKVIPDVVYKPKDEQNDLWGIDYSKFSPVLVKAIQEQQKEIEELKRENKEMKEEIMMLKSKIEK